MQCQKGETKNAKLKIIRAQKKHQKKERKYKNDAMPCYPLLCYAMLCNHQARLIESSALCMPSVCLSRQLLELAGWAVFKLILYSRDRQGRTHHSINAFPFPSHSL